MILALLDTGMLAVQTMAFIVPTEKLNQLTSALLILENENNWGPVHKLGLENRRRLSKATSEMSYVVDSTWLVDLAERTRKCAERLRLPADLNDEIQKFGLNKKVLLPPRSFLSLAQLHRAPDLAEKALHDEDPGLRFIATARIQTLIETLKAWNVREDLGYDQPGPYEDEAGQVTIPTDTFEDDPTPEEVSETVRERALSQLYSYSLLEALTGPFMRSRGPGPFLPPPPMAQKTDHFISFQYLDVTSLPEAMSWLEQTKEPDLKWQKSFGLEFSLEEWNQAVADHWLRCRQRFSDLLTSAKQEGQSVLFLENEISHPFLFEGPWPESQRESKS